MVPPPTHDDDSETIPIDADELDAYREATDFAPGGMVGRYQLCFELASGGMAKVYLARVGGAAGFDKLVALKRIHPHLSDQHEFLEMFMDEARLASRIDHPNVCTVFDFGHAGREHFIAMEYLLGETLGRLARHVDAELAASPRWWAIAMRIVVETCEGLQAAHELRNDEGEPLEVVHRDVTPANVFVTYDGAVKVVDFGVARAQERVHQTRAGRVKGQYAYMAPEQATGKPLDRRADVWSLGVLLWELLAGKRLFERDNEAATLMAVVHGEIPPLRDVRPELPADVAALVTRTLSLEPKRRPATARALARELDRCIARLGEPVSKADLGDLMERLFADDIIRRRRMIADARRLEAGRVLKVEDSNVAPLSSRTRPVELDEEPTSFDLHESTLNDLVTAPADEAPSAPEPSFEPPPLEPRPTRGRAGLAIAALLGATALVAIAGVVAMLGSDGPPVEVTSLPPAIPAPALDDVPVAAPMPVADTDERGAEPSAVADPAIEPGGEVDTAPARDPIADGDERRSIGDDTDATEINAIAADDELVDEGDEALTEDEDDEPTAGASSVRRPRPRPRERSRISATVARAPGTVNVVT
ncbi:MAG: protein kinase, partial [Myxococcota bacterium]|nr:protein kinase [Myxococcota bacterium]